MEGGTEAFPELGIHCQHSDCHQLDFLPFKCNGCEHVFCLEHRSYESHDCPKSYIGSRKVVVCSICSSVIETTGRCSEEEKMVLEGHEKSGDCDPRKGKRATCPVRRCKEVLTFSNTLNCKSCGINVCLKHRFPVDHACKGNERNEFRVSFAARSGEEYGDKKIVGSAPLASPRVNAYSLFMRIGMSLSGEEYGDKKFVGSESSSSPWVNAYSLFMRIGMSLYDSLNRYCARLFRVFTRNNHQCRV